MFKVGDQVKSFSTGKEVIGTVTRRWGGYVYVLDNAIGGDCEYEFYDCELQLVVDTELIQ